MHPKAFLIAHDANIAERVYQLHIIGEVRSSQQIPITLSEVVQQCTQNAGYHKKVMHRFEQAVLFRSPMLKCINLTFWCGGFCQSLIDTFRWECPKSTILIQDTIEFTKFARRYEYYCPEEFEGALLTDGDGKSMSAVNAFHELCLLAESTFDLLLQAGVTRADAQQILPRGTQFSVIIQTSLLEMLDYISHPGPHGKKELILSIKDELFRVYPMLSSCVRGI